MPINGISGLAASGTSAGNVNKGVEINAEEFLKMLSAEMSNQNPMDPMKNSDFLGQVSQINNLQMINKLSDTIQTMLLRESVFQAGSLLDRMVEYVDDNGGLQTGLVRDVRIDGDGKVKLGLTDGGEVELNSVRRVLMPAAQEPATAPVV